MTFADRLSGIKGKLRFYVKELVGLKDAEFKYFVIFGLLLAVLLPVLVIEILVLFVFGLDAEINQTRPAPIARELHEDEVPPELKTLIPYAKKWGVGDASEREALIENEPLSELTKLNHLIGSRIEEIDDWLATYSETDLAHSATAGYFLFLCVAHEEVKVYLEEREG